MSERLDVTSIMSNHFLAGRMNKNGPPSKKDKKPVTIAVTGFFFGVTGLKPWTFNP
jgi:hypothetical protein